MFYACPYPYPTIVVNPSYPAYYCIAASTDGDESHADNPWGYNGHGGGQWTYDYVDAEWWALEECQYFHPDCYLVQCFSY